MLTLIDRYIGKTIIKTISLTLFLLIGISGIVRFIEQSKRISETYDGLAISLYTLLMIPKDIELFFAVACMIGALIGLGMLASRSEIVIMQSAGLSKFAISFSVMKTTFLLIFIAMILNEWVSPYCEQFARNYRVEKLYGSKLLASEDSFWAKDGNDYIHIGKINADDSLRDVNIYHTSFDGKLNDITHASSAKFKDNHWTLSNVDKTDFINDKIITKSTLLYSDWQSSITPEKLNIVAQRGDSLSARKLYTYIEYLEKSGIDSRQYQLYFCQKLFKPISIAVMMLLGLSAIFGPLRSVSMGTRFISGTFIGFSFYIADSFIAKITLVLGIAPVLGAIFASLIFFIISLLLFRRSK